MVGAFKTINMKKQVWCKSEIDQPIRHEYDLEESKNQYFEKVTTLSNSMQSDFGEGKQVATLTEHGDGYSIVVYDTKIELDYSDAECLLALLSSVYDTTMEIRESVIKTKIN
jgi:hypothetical protein